MTEKGLRDEVEKYFAKCSEEGVPPTPSGLALSLDVRTSMLSDERLSVEQKRVISRAMQRIEANTMEMILKQGGLKGMENVLERVEEDRKEKHDRRKEALRRMTDEEIREKLGKLMPRIEKAMEKK